MSTLPNLLAFLPFKYDCIECKSPPSYWWREVFVILRVVPVLWGQANVRACVCHPTGNRTPHMKWRSCLSSARSSLPVPSHFRLGSGSLWRHWAASRVSSTWPKRTGTYTESERGRQRDCRCPTTTWPSAGTVLTTETCFFIVTGIVEYYHYVFLDIY